MSQARFDAGQSIAWHPMGFFQSGQNVSAAPSVLVNLDPGTGGVIRIDWASLVLRFSVTDVEAHCEMSLVITGGVYTAFLATSAGVGTGSVGNKIAAAQLSLPFYVTQALPVAIRGGYALFGASDFDATISYSHGYLF
jgi:hypothetical protein